MKKIKVFEYRVGWGDVEDYVVEPLNEFLSDLKKEYSVEYVSTGKGFCAIVTYED